MYRKKDTFGSCLKLNFFILFLISCNFNNPVIETSKNSHVDRGRVLAVENGCMWCHSVTFTVVGPAWNLVAKQYRNKPGSRAFLIGKIKRGGKGSWNSLTGGQTMPGHEDKISDEDIGKLVDYILALDVE